MPDEINKQPILRIGAQDDTKPAIDSIKSGLGSIAPAADRAAKSTNKSLASMGAGAGDATANIARFKDAFGGIGRATKDELGESARFTNSFVSQLKRSAADVDSVTQSIVNRARTLQAGDTRLQNSNVDQAIAGLQKLADQNAIATAATKKQAEATAESNKRTNEAAAAFANFERSAQAARLELLSFGKTASEKYEIRARLTGLDKNQATQQIIADLKAAEVAALAAGKGVGQNLAPALQGAALQGKALNAALRQVPAQFTDIIVSLQGGQAPLTVLLQQGGQLKDVFGGIVPAAKALGGFIVSLINPFTVLAASAGVFALAAYQGAKDSQELSKALILTGNAAGTTADQLASTAAAIDAAGGATKSQAVEALVAFSKAANVATADYGRFAAVAIETQRLTGVAVADTVKQYERLGKEPLKASVDLNESTNFLTASLVKQIAELEKQGKTTEAASLAQRALADNQEQVNKKIEASLGTLDRALNSTTRLWREFWDAAKDVGRPQTVAEQIDALRGQITPTVDGRTNRFTAGKSEELANLLEIDKLSKRAALAEGERALATRQTAKFLEDGLKFQTKQQQLATELLKLEQNTAAARRAGNISEEEYQKRRAAIQAQFAEKKTGGSKEEIGDQQKSLASYVAELQKRLDKEQELTEVQKANNLLASLGTIGQIPQVRELVTQLAKKIDIEKESEVAAKAAAKSIADYVKEQEKQVEGYVKAADAATKSVQKYLDEEAALTIATEKNISLAQAIELVNIARLREEQIRLQADLTDDGAQEKIDNINKEIAAREKLIGLIGNKENRDIAKKAAEDAAKEWKRAAEQIESALTDSLLRGFENGKGFAENFRDTVENLFKTLVLRPIVQATVQGALGLNQGGGALGAAGTLGGLGNAIAGLGNVASTLGFALTDFKEFSTFATQDLGAALSKAGFTNAGGTLTTNASGIGNAVTIVGEGLSYLEALSNFKDGSFGKSIGQGVALAFSGGNPIVGQIGKELGSQLDRIFGGDQGPTNTGVNSSFAADGTLISRVRPGNSQTSSEAVDVFTSLLSVSYQAALTKFGATGKATTFGFQTTTDGKFDVSTTIGGSTAFQQGTTANSPEALNLAASRAVFAALQASELPAYLSKAFSGIVADSASQQQIDSALGFAESLKGIRLSLLSASEQATEYQRIVDANSVALGTTAVKFKDDFVAAIDAGLTPEGLVRWQELGAQITALEQITGKAAAGVDDFARSLADIANERKGLQDKLDQATLTTAQLLEKQRNALDESNRALFDQVQSAEAAKTAADELAQAQADQAQAATDAAAQLVSTNASLQNRLGLLTGAQTERSLELAAATDASTKAILAQIFAQEDANTAAQAAAAAAENLRNTNQTLQNQLDVLTGAQTDRSIQLRDAADESTKALLRQIFAQQDLKSAQENYTRTIEDLTQKLANARNAAASAQSAVDGVRGEATSAYLTALGNVESAQQRIADLQLSAQQELARAANDAAGQMADLGRQLREFVNGTQLKPSDNFARLLSLSLAGDKEATKGLSAAAGSAIDAAKGNATSGAEFALAQARIIGQVASVATLAELAGKNTVAVPGSADPLVEANKALAQAQLQLSQALATANTIGAPLTASVTDLIAKFTDANTAFATATADLARQQAALDAIQGNTAATNSAVGGVATAVDGTTTAVTALGTALAQISANTLNTSIAIGGINTGATSTVTFAANDPVLSIFNNISKTNELLIDGLQLQLKQLLGVSFSEALTAAGAQNSEFLGTYSLWSDSRNFLSTIATYVPAMMGQLLAIAQESYRTNVNWGQGLRVVFARGGPGENVFATGGAFTNGIVSRPTSFDMGQMGEAGPEAIVPLANINGMLGIRSAGDPALREEMRLLRGDNAAQARALVQAQQRMAKILERWDGTGIPEERVTA